MKYYFAWIFLYFASLLWLIFTLCFSVMQKEPRRQRFFRESRQTILQKSRPNGNLKSIIENPRKKCTYNRNQNCGHFQPHLHFWVNKKKKSKQVCEEKSTKWRCDEVIFYSYYKKISTNQFYPFYYYAYVWNQKSSKIQFGNFHWFFLSQIIFHPPKNCRLVQRKLFVRIFTIFLKNLWIFLRPESFLTKHYLHAKRIFIKYENMWKNLWKNFGSKNLRNQNFAMKKKYHHFF